MTKIISATPLLTIRRGDVVAVNAGHHEGQTGEVLCVFKGWVTVDPGDGQAFMVKLADCKTSEAAGKSGLDTTHQTA